MTDILHQFPIEAPPERIFDAIATPEGLSAWWTSQVEAEPRVGTVAVFHFGTGPTVFRMRIEALERPTRVAWHCVGDHDEWKDTNLTFTLTPKDGDTILRFTHAGWRSPDGWIADCSYTWAHVLARLKAYAEEGRREPYFP